MAFTSTRLVGLDILHGLLQVASHVEGVARSLGDRETEIQGNAARNGAEADDDTPHLVDRKLANTVTLSHGLGRLKRPLEASGDDQGNDGSGELSDALHGEDGTHHGTSPLGSGKSVGIVNDCSAALTKSVLLGGDD